MNNRETFKKHKLHTAQSHTVPEVAPFRVWKAMRDQMLQSFVWTEQPASSCSSPPANLSQGQGARTGLSLNS